MARSLASKTNVTAPGGDYPYGRVKDESSAGAFDGTPVNEVLVGDAMQFFDRLLAEGFVTANGNPENSSDGFQYLEALKNVVKLQPPYFAYRTKLTQSSTSAPVNTDATNSSYDASVTWARSSTGIYTCTFGQLPPSADVSVFVGSVNGSTQLIYATWSSPVLTLRTYVSGSLSDGVLTSTSLEVRFENVNY
jgi:hypothetical protein